jgi:hypothetical protein
VFQEASYYHNRRKPGDTSRISETQCHQFLELHNTIYAAAVATMRMSGAMIDRKKLQHTQNKVQIPPSERRLKTQLDDWEKTLEECNRPKMAIPITGCKNTTAG